MPWRELFKLLLLPFPLRLHRLNLKPGGTVMPERISDHPSHCVVHASPIRSAAASDSDDFSSPRRAISCCTVPCTAPRSTHSRGALAPSTPPPLLAWAALASDLPMLVHRANDACNTSGGAAENRDTNEHVLKTDGGGLSSASHGCRASGSSGGIPPSSTARAQSDRYRTRRMYAEMSWKRDS